MPEEQNFGSNYQQLGQKVSTRNPIFSSNINASNGKKSFCLETQVSARKGNWLKICPNVNFSLLFQFFVVNKYTHCRSWSTPSTLKSDKIFFEIKTCASMTSEKIENPRLDWAENYFRKFIFVYINVAYWKYKNVKLKETIGNQTSALEFGNLFKFFFFFKTKVLFLFKFMLGLRLIKTKKIFS